MTAITTTWSEIFESETCTRCGGTGQYSFNQIDGTMCYGCRGAKRKLTKRGAAAREYLHWLQSVPAKHVKPGDRIYSDGWRTVTDVRPGSTGWILSADDPKVAKLAADGARVAPYKAGKVVVHAGVDLVTSKVTLASQTGTVRVSDPSLTVAYKQAVAAYQDSLTKAGTPRKK